MAADVVVCLLRYRAVDAFAGLVAAVDEDAELVGEVFVALHEQVDRGVSARRSRHVLLPVHGHAAGGVDAGSYLEHDVVYRDFMPLQTANLDDGLQPLAWLLIQFFETVMGQYPVLAHERYDIRRGAHHDQVEQTHDTFERNALVLAVSLHEFESNSAAGEFVERIVVSGLFRVEYRHGGRYLLSRQMVVTDDEVDSELVGIGHFLDGFDAAVECDDEVYSVLFGIVHAKFRDAVPFRITVGYVEEQLFHPHLAKENVNQSHGSGSVHVVIAVDHDFLTARHGFVHPAYRLLHILHQERVVQVRQLRTEEPRNFVVSVYAPLYE